MTQFLASVRDTAEAEIVLAAGADIVDLKDPEKGALGAVAPDVIEDCVAAVAGRVPVSATVGDLPMMPGPVTRAVAATDTLGVDIVKLGVLPGGDPETCFAALRALNLRARLILVFFADAMVACDPAEAARSAGAHGLMLDTARKEGGALPDHMDMTAIARFVDAGRHAGLMTGVAGSLRASHVAPLLNLHPDVMGFRGALCRDGIRDRTLDPEACRQIRALIPAPHAPNARFGESQAAALC